MACVGDPVMLCSIVLYDMWRCYGMLICIHASCSGLLRLIGLVGILWPRGSGLSEARLNVVSRGSFALNDVRCVSLVNRVLA